jgi:IS30 family transposase
MPYQHFTSDDRDALQILQASGDVPAWFIARVLGKHVSSIYRELSRNKKSGVYLSHHADIAAQKRRQASKPRPKRENARLMAEIELRLKQDHSPEQIAGRLKLEHPEESFWHVSHETIYQHVYSRIRAGADLKAHLRQGRKKRRKRLSQKGKRGVIPDRVFIDKCLKPFGLDNSARLIEESSFKAGRSFPSVLVGEGTPNNRKRSVHNYLVSGLCVFSGNFGCYDLRFRSVKKPNSL